MKILWVKADKLLPVHCGGNIRSFNLLRELATRHELTYFSYYDGMPDADYEQELNRHFPGSVCVCTQKKTLSGLRRGLDYLLHLPNAGPYAVTRFASRQVQLELAALLYKTKFDIAICDFLDAAVNFPKVMSIPTVLFQHNVESEIWRRHSETETSFPKRLVYRIEAARMLRYEQASVQRFDHVIAVSENDRRIMSQWVDPSRITVVPTGVDLQQFRPENPPREVGPLIMFVGAMDWKPNIDAVEYFCRDIWPRILSAVPAAHFRIVGRHPDRRVLDLASNSITITGSVPSVVEHMRDATVVVVPLQVGGGTRLKIYEAMAAGKAVVSTTVGAEGLEVHDGRDIVLADDPSSFAAAVVTLLRDEQLRRRYQRAAAELAARFDWPAIGEQFSRVLEIVTGGGSSAVPRNAWATKS